MSERDDPAQGDDGGPGGRRNPLAPLPGEPGIPSVARQRRGALSRKGLFALGLVVVSMVAVPALWLQRWATSGQKAEEDHRLMSDRPAAATSRPRRLEMPSTAAAVKASEPRIPALQPAVEDVAEPIGVRRTGPGAPTGGTKPAAPEDAPIMLVATRPGAGAAASARVKGRFDTAAGPAESGDAGNPDDPLAATTRNLQAYQQQLQGLLDGLGRTTTAATAGPPTGWGPLGTSPGGGSAPIGPQSGGPPSPSASLYNGSPPAGATPRVAATRMGHRSLTLPRGTAFTCALKTRVVSAASGLIGCLVQRDVFGDDGRVLLVERGSHLDGEYRVASVRPGTVRIPVVWTRLRTPNGITVDIESPGTGPLGESGIDGHVDNRWGERVGTALLLSLIDDAVKLVVQAQSDRNDSNSTSTVVLPSTTAGTSRLAEKVLDSTINIPPLVHRNQGGIVGIHVARDVDFSSVYELKPVAP